MMSNENTSIEIDVQAIDRAHWAFEQPTLGGVVSSFTYNEYPLAVNKLVITDELGQELNPIINGLGGMPNIRGEYCINC